MANVEVDMEEARPGPPICRPAKGAADLLSVKKEARILPAFLRPTLLRPTHALSRPSSATQSASRRTLRMDRLGHGVDLVLQPCQRRGTCLVLRFDPGVVVRQLLNC